MGNLALSLWQTALPAKAGQHQGSTYSLYTDQNLADGWVKQNLSTHKTKTVPKDRVPPIWVKAYLEISGLIRLEQTEWGGHSTTLERKSSVDAVQPSKVPSRTLSADRAVMKQVGGLRHPLLGQGALYSTTLENVSSGGAKQPSWCTKPHSTA